MDEIRTVFLLFSKEKEFNGWMIMKLHFQKEKKIEMMKKEIAKKNIMETIVLRKKKEYALLGLLWKKGLVLMYLYKPKFLIENNKEIIQKKKGNHTFLLTENYKRIDSKIFLKEEIKEFVKEVRDDNWIHQMEKPVVPGFMMVEWVWNRKEISLWNKVMIFYEPVYAQEEIELYLDISSEHYIAVKKTWKNLKKEMLLLWEIKKK